MPVLPLVGSTMVPPGFSLPSRSAASMMREAMRSFEDPPGLRYSTLARIVGASPAVTLLSLTSGVLPMRSRTVLAYFMVVPIYQRASVRYGTGSVTAGTPIHLHRHGKEHTAVL